MICQIRKVNPPTCRTAISRKTAARMMTVIYVHEGWEYRVIGIGFCRTSRSEVRPEKNPSAFSGFRMVLQDYEDRLMALFLVPGFYQPLHP
jgi:hypothetical protein